MIKIPRFTWEQITLHLLSEKNGYVNRWISPHTHPKTVWITSCQVSVCNALWKELELSQWICSCLCVSVCMHAVAGRGVCGSVSEWCSLNYTGNLKVLSHSCFEADCIKRKHSETFMALHEERKIGMIRQNTEANAVEYHGEGWDMKYVTYEERLTLMCCLGWRREGKGGS